MKKKCNIIYVGTDENEKNDALISNIRVEDGKTLFDLDFDGKKYNDLEIPAIGRHFAINAAFAAVSGLLLGCDEENIRRGLAAYQPSGMRQSITDRCGIKLIADCYNAAPESMRAALEVLSEMKISGKRIAVLGDMRELGAGSDELHRELGKFAACRVDVLLTLGESGALIAEGAVSGGLDSARVFACKDVENAEILVERIKSEISQGDAILFKASRALRLERIIEAIF